jgi:large conductance mechanosensitive channel
VINYGKFLQTIIDFIIIVLALFLVVKLVNSLKRKEEQVVPSPSKEELLLQEIRDLLKEHLNKQS